MMRDTRPSTGKEQMVNGLSVDRKQASLSRSQSALVFHPIEPLLAEPFVSLASNVG